MNNKIIAFTGCLLIACMISAFTYAQEKTRQDKLKTVLLIPLKFENNEWSYKPDEVDILPCESPALPTKGTSTDPMIQLLGKEKVLFEYHFVDPRIFLPEDYKGEYALLDKVDFILRLHLTDGAEEFRFFYKPGKEGQNEKPTLVIDLRKYIENYQRNGGEDQKAPCQEEQFVPDQRPRK